MGVRTQQLDFAEFYRSTADECLRAVLISVGNQDSARGHQTILPLKAPKNDLNHQIIHDH